MRPTTFKALAGSALLSLTAQPVDATLGHRHFHHHRHGLNHTHKHGQDADLVKRGRLVNRAGQCEFPQDAGLVTVTPQQLNAGWAMSPDQECTAGSYCPYACPPGQLMNQWKPGTTYVYPESMDGGAYCDENGLITKPFPDQDYCVEGIGNVNAVNNCGDEVAVCQTVLPGNEAMLIPTSVSSSAVISVPGTSYWDSTAAHFYVNQPGHTTEEACIWGDGSSPIGNWAAYVIGTNQDATGDTYVKVGWNPIYTEAFPGVKPNFGVKIECDGTCVGLPCSIDPSTDGFGGVNSEEASTGAGGADFCVVTVTSGSANVVFFNTDGSTGSSSSGSSSSSGTTTAAHSEPATSEPATTKPKPTSSQAAVVVLGLHAVATTSETSTSPPTTTSLPTTSPSSTEISTTSPASSTSHASTSLASSTSRPASTTLVKPSGGYGGVFQESDGTTNGTASSGSVSTTSSADSEDTTAAAPAATTSSKSIASKDQAAFAGLVVAIVAAACLY